MPTLGAWLSMAISLSQFKSKNDLMVPEIDQYVNHFKNITLWTG